MTQISNCGAAVNTPARSTDNESIPLKRLNPALCHHCAAPLRGSKDSAIRQYFCDERCAASAAYVAAKVLGYKVHLYDGSFEDWSGRDDLPVYLEAKKDSVKK